MLFYVVTVYPTLSSSKPKQCLIHLYGFSTGQTLGKCWTGWSHPCCADTNHRNGTEQSVDRLWKCKVSGNQRGLLKPHWFE